MLSAMAIEWMLKVRTGGAKNSLGASYLGGGESVS